MENPLQEIAGGFTFASMKKLIALFATLFPLLVLTPLEAQANLECSNGTCSQSFYFVGAPEVFVLPEAVTRLTFEVRAASGSRGGGGGIIRGTMVNPPSSFSVVVGQAGSMGINRAGGYNGGGASGGSRGNEGSGGGASDIRFGPDLESRVVVAGAGGGGGAGGILGGAGGELFAAEGSSSQGRGGGGGTQDAGGTPGINSWGTIFPTEGSFGFGGTGGFGDSNGGGGGGGGWYGGGGGGGSYAQDNGGGGGGGGSSYAMADLTTNVTHEVGANYGHGRIVISYQQPAEVVSFTANQLSRTQIKFLIGMSQNVQGFSAEDVTYSDATCSIWRTAIVGTVAEVTLDSCQSSEVTLTLKERSIGNSTAGPVEPVSFTATIDREGPNFSWQPTQEWISTTSLIVEFAISDDLVVQSSSFEVLGCELGIQDKFAILTNCSEGINSITLPSQSLQDSWENPGPAEDKVLSFTVDTTAPVASWSEVVVSGNGPFSYSAVLTFSEQVFVTTTAVSFSSSVDCEHGNDGLSFWASCDYGTVGWSLNLTEVTDLAGNSNSGVAQVSRENPRPIVAPEPDPQPATVPTAVSEPQPNPEPAPEPVVAEPAPIQAPATESPVTPETPTESEPVEVVTGLEEVEMIAEPIEGGMVVVELPPRPAAATAAVAQLGNVEPVQTEPTSSVEVAQQLQGPEPLGSATIEPVAGPEIEFTEQPQLPWLLIAGLGFLLLLGLGFWRFSGR